MAQPYTPFKLRAPSPLILVKPNSSLQPYIHLRLIPPSSQQEHMNTTTTPQLLYELLKQEIIIPHVAKWVTYPTLTPTLTLNYQLNKVSSLDNVRITGTSFNVSTHDLGTSTILRNSRVAFSPTLKVRSPVFILPPKYPAHKLSKLVKQVQRDLFLDTI